MGAGDVFLRDTEIDAESFLGVTERIELKDLFESINKLKDISGSKAKIYFIKKKYEEKDELFIETIKFLLDPNKVTGISKAKINKEVRVKPRNILFNLLDLIEEIVNNNTGSDQMIADVQAYIKMVGDFEQDIKDIFTKSHKLGINIKGVNKAIPNFIPSIEFMRAKNYMDRYEKGLFDFGRKYTISQKLDGIRCCFVKDKEGHITAYSRQGKVISGLNDILKALEHNAFNSGYVYDGELLALGEFETEEEKFQKTCSIVNSNSDNKKELEFVMFDVIPIDDFYNGYSPMQHSERIGNMFNSINLYRGENTENHCITDIRFKEYFNFEDNTLTHDGLMVLVDNCDREGKEGIMINDSLAPWAGKRTSDILKLKKNLIADVRITGFVAGEGKHTGRLGALEVEFDYKGIINKCNIGTGFTDEEREEFWNNQSEHIGKIIEVKYQKITKAENGDGYALGFASYNHRIRTDKNETNV